jgi:hypothetical protein
MRTMSTDKTSKGNRPTTSRLSNRYTTRLETAATPSSAIKALNLIDTLRGVFFGELLPRSTFRAERTITRPAGCHHSPLTNHQPQLLIESAPIRNTTYLVENKDSAPVLIESELACRKMHSRRAPRLRSIGRLGPVTSIVVPAKIDNPSDAHIYLIPL